MVERAIAGAVGRFTQWYGPLRREPRVTVIEIPDGFGSQASLSAGIIQTAAAFRDRADLPQLYHELSHVWNVADLERPSPRWNEGLASFLEYRMAAELDGWADWDRIVGWYTQSAQRGCAASRCDSIPLARYGSAQMTDRSYSVGMLMFYVLFQTLGAEGFDRAYRDFFQRYQSAGGTSTNLAEAFRRVAPGLSAGESLTQMIEGYRRPRSTP
jgi:aminopeptidase N